MYNQQVALHNTNTQHSFTYVMSTCIVPRGEESTSMEVPQSVLKKATESTLSYSRRSSSSGGSAAQIYKYILSHGQITNHIGSFYK